MTRKAAKVDPHGVVVDVILVDDYIPDGYQIVDVAIGVGQSLADVVRQQTEDAVRAERDKLLADTDWIVTKAIEQNAQDGFGVQIPVVWLDYRQALRDIPQQPGFPDNVTWPTKPA